MFENVAFVTYYYVKNVKPSTPSRNANGTGCSETRGSIKSAARSHGFANPCVALAKLFLILSFLLRSVHANKCTQHYCHTLSTVNRKKRYSRNAFLISNTYFLLSVYLISYLILKK